MVRGGRSGRVSTSVGRGSTRIGFASPSTPVVLTTGSASPCTPVFPAIDNFAGTTSPMTPVVLATEVESHHPMVDEEGPQLPGRQPCWISRGKIDPGFASRYITSLVHAHVLGPVDSWKEFPPSVWELLFDMFTLRRDYWESLCHRWATGPWQERSQAAKRNRAVHPEKNRHELERAPTFRELFDRTHKRKGTDDYVSESTRTIAKTYDRTMADRYAEGTPQPNLDPEAWVDAAGGPRKGRVYGLGDSLDTTPVLSSYASSVAPPAYSSSSAAPPNSGGEDMRTLIRKSYSCSLA
ncbi:hypothetical protein Taro_034471 [Colocasia esculenta]|uniref:Transposase n=1 Tax=Colocasia esculenta TaxID=4460 RepID=A0A843WA58_COLES|nr:hypothetical protein [Colocasia esculenta]